MNKAFWRSIAETDYAVPAGYDLAELVNELVDYLDSPDPELRDDIAFSTLAQWIVHQPQVPPALLHQMEGRLVARLATAGSHQDSDDIFGRSFAVLVLGLFAYHDNQHRTLTKGDIETFLFATLEYLDRELDLRGYVAGKGWAHALAHTADTLKFLARNRYTNAEHHQQILQALAHKLQTPTERLFMYDEDERLALTVLEVMKRGLVSVSWLADWLQAFVIWKQNLPQDMAFDAANFGAHQNIKHMLRSLYFQLAKPEAETVIDDALLTPLRVAVYRTVRAFNF